MTTVPGPLPAGRVPRFLCAAARSPKEKMKQKLGMEAGEEGLGLTGQFPPQNGVRAQALTRQGWAQGRATGRGWGDPAAPLREPTAWEQFSRPRSRRLPRCDRTSHPALRPLELHGASRYLYGQRQKRGSSPAAPRQRGAGVSPPPPGAPGHFQGHLPEVSSAQGHTSQSTAARTPCVPVDVVSSPSTRGAPHPGHAPICPWRVRGRVTLAPISQMGNGDSEGDRVLPWASPVQTAPHQPPSLPV